MISEYQVMPITKATFIGAPTAELTAGHELIRVLAGDALATLTFTFDDASTKVITPPVGVTEWVIAGDCVSVTSTLVIVMS